MSLLVFCRRKNELKLLFLLDKSSAETVGMGALLQSLWLFLLPMWDSTSASFVKEKREGLLEMSLQACIPGSHFQSVSRPVPGAVGSAPFPVGSFPRSYFSAYYNCCQFFSQPNAKAQYCCLCAKIKFCFVFREMGCIVRCTNFNFLPYGRQNRVGSVLKSRQSSLNGFVHPSWSHCNIFVSFLQSIYVFNFANSTDYEDAVSEWIGLTHVWDRLLQFFLWLLFVCLFF